MSSGQRILNQEVYTMYEEREKECSANGVVGVEGTQAAPACLLITSNDTVHILVSD